MRALAGFILAISLSAAGRAEADHLHCQLVVMDSLSRPVAGAAVTCAGLKATHVPEGGYFVARGEVPRSPTVEVRIAHWLFLPTVMTVAPTHPGVVSSVAWLRRPGDVTVRTGVHDVPYVAERDRLRVNLDRHDRSAGTIRSRADVLAELAPLLATWALVEAPSRAVPPPPGRGERCGWPDDELIPARADGAAFPPAGIDALAALRAHPRVRAAGPLLRRDPYASGELNLGHVIQVHALPHGAAIEDFARRHHAAWDPSTRALRLPASTGLAATAIARELARTIPGAVAELDLEGEKLCTD